MTNETYNGWSNYETWNAALWIQNSGLFYSQAVNCSSYADFLSYFELGDDNRTPDGVLWTDPALDFSELDRMITELAA